MTEEHEKIPYDALEPYAEHAWNRTEFRNLKGCRPDALWELQPREGQRSLMRFLYSAMELNRTETAEDTTTTAPEGEEGPPGHLSLSEYGEYVLDAWEMFTYPTLDKVFKDSSWNDLPTGVRLDLIRLAARVARMVWKERGHVLAPRIASPPDIEQVEVIYIHTVIRGDDVLHFNPPKLALAHQVRYTYDRGHYAKPEEILDWERAYVKETETEGRTR